MRYGHLYYLFFMETNFILSLVVISIVAGVIRFLFGQKRSVKEPKMSRDNEYKIY